MMMFIVGAMHYLSGVPKSVIKLPALQYIEGGQAGRQSWLLAILYCIIPYAPRTNSIAIAIFLYSRY